MKRYMIERDMPGLGKKTIAEVREAARNSNQGLDKLAPDIQWVESFLAGDKTFCVYLAKNEDVIREHGRITGIPVTKITEIARVIDPTTAKGA